MSNTTAKRSRGADVRPPTETTPDLTAMRERVARAIERHKIPAVRAALDRMDLGSLLRVLHGEHVTRGTIARITMYLPALDALDAAADAASTKAANKGRAA
jgi:hypothetical protein